jgi:hypothetical protein
MTGFGATIAHRRETMSAGRFLALLVVVYVLPAHGSTLEGTRLRARAPARAEQACPEPTAVSLAATA